MVRLTFAGEGLREFRWPGPASHLKVFLTELGSDAAETPHAEGSGRTGTDPERTYLTSRTFTPRRWDGPNGSLEVEFLLHAKGPASRWAARAVAGDGASLSQPRRTYEIPPETPWLLLIGDASALPAIATLLEAIDREVTVQVLVEVENPDYQVELPEHPRLDLRWLFARPGARPGSSLCAAVAAWAPPGGPGQVWAACEALAVRAVRGQLLGPLGLPVERVLTRGYWRMDEANYPDHDYGE